MESFTAEDLIMLEMFRQHFVPAEKSSGRSPRNSWNRQAEPTFWWTSK